MAALERHDSDSIDHDMTADDKKVCEDDVIEVPKIVACSHPLDRAMVLMGIPFCLSWLRALDESPSRCGDPSV